MAAVLLLIVVSVIAGDEFDSLWMPPPSWEAVLLLIVVSVIAGDELVL